MKRRILAIMLAGVLAFSQSGAVLAADNSASGDTSAEMTAAEAAEESASDEAGPEDLEEASEPETPAEAEPSESVEAVTEENEEVESEEITQEEVEEPIEEEPEETVQEKVEETEEEEPADSSEAQDLTSGQKEEEPAAEPETGEEENEEALTEEAPEEKSADEAALALGDENIRITPEQFPDPDMHLGEEIDITPKVEIEDGNGGFAEAQGADIRYEWDYDENDISVTDKGDGSFAVRRKSDNEIEFSVRAFITRDGDTAETEQTYHLNDKPYWVSIRDEQAGGLFEDSTGDFEWSCPIEMRDFDGADYVLTAEVTEHDGPQGADADSACRVESGERKLFFSTISFFSFERMKIRLSKISLTRIPAL